MHKTKFRSVKGQAWSSAGVDCRFAKTRLATVSLRRAIHFLATDRVAEF
jgi:hypothetical protein